jgi:hypothetical protein
MGIYTMSIGGTDNLPEQQPSPDRNPDPYNYQLGQFYEVGNLLVVEITYPNCNNYEGKKILLFEDMNMDRLRTHKQIDPHFIEDHKVLHLLARFKPTEAGFKQAVAFANLIVTPT